MKLQAFASGCIRSTAQGRWAALDAKPLSNNSIRAQCNIPTIESGIQYLRRRMYIDWGTARSKDYLGDTQYIRDQLESISTENSRLQTAITVCMDQKEDMDTLIGNRPLYNCLQYRKRGMIAKT